MKSIRIFLTFILVVHSGCATSLYTADFKQLYDQSASHQDLERNPVIVIPGILGSKLKDAPTGKDVWGAFSGAYANPKTDEGVRLMALPMKEHAAFAELRDEVYPAGALDKVVLNLFFLPVRLNAYFHILRALGVGGYRDQQLAEAGAIDYGKDHFTCFQYAYDWRRDLVEGAKVLHEFILKRKAYVREEFQKRFGVDNPEIKFDIVAHSMAGLLVRYYLRYGVQDLPEDGSLPQLTWAGSEHIEKVVLIGTPNAGSALALDHLVHGIKVGPFTPFYDPAIVGTMPSVYQLLPRTRHQAILNRDTPESPGLNIYDVDVWQKMNWGLAADDQTEVLEILLPEEKSAEVRRRIALDHLEKSLKRAEQFHKALDVPAFPPEGLKMYLFAGDAESTAAVLSVNSDKGKITVHEQKPGDGTVTRASALMDERMGAEWTPKLITPIRWSSTLFLFENHVGITRDPVFIDNLLYILLEEPRYLSENTLSGQAR